MPLYSVNVDIVATAYIRASSEAEARELASQLWDVGIEVPDGDWGVEVSGRGYSDPDLPVVSLSPAMTLLGPGDIDSIECVDDD
jgi:hypothetical protein